MSEISGLEEKHVKAHFHFVCVDPSKLTRELALDTINGTFEIAGARNAEQDLFTQFVAFVEDDGTAPDSGKPLYKGAFPLQGEQHRFKLEVSEGILKEKIASEAQHFRNPGHESTVAPQHLTSKTLVMIVGSRGFLAEFADINFERQGVLRKKLVLLLKDIAKLVERKSTKRFSHIFVPVAEKEYYPGNFDALLAEVRKTRRSTAELFQFLDEKAN